MITNTDGLRPLLPLLLGLAAPVFAEQALHLLVGLVDTWLTGNLIEGNDAMAAIGLVAYLVWMLSSLCSAVSIGATAMIARYVGAGDIGAASRATQQALLLGLAVSLLVTGLVAIGITPFVSWMRLQPMAAKLTVDYLTILVPVIPALMVQQVGIASLRGAGDTVSGLLAMIVVNGVNAGLSTALAIGIPPFPKLGWRGLAIGTAAGYLVGGLLIATILYRGRKGLRIAGLGWNLDCSMMLRLLRVGVPGGVDRVAIVSCHLWYVSIITALGTFATAAHSLAIRIESLAYVPGTAFEVAAATLAGQSLGAGHRRRAVDSVLLCSLVCLLFMVTMGLIFFIGADPLTQFFAGQRADGAAAEAAQLLRLVAPALVPFSLMVVLTGALRGSGDTRWPLVISLIGFFCVRIPFAHWLAWSTIDVGGQSISGWSLGVRGAWMAMVADLLVRATLLGIRFLQGGWKDARV